MKQNIPVCSSHQSNLCANPLLSCVMVVSLQSILYNPHQFMWYNMQNAALFTCRSLYEQLKLTLCNENHSIGYSITFCLMYFNSSLFSSSRSMQLLITQKLKSATSCFFQRTTIHIFKSSTSIPQEIFKRKKNL